MCKKGKTNTADKAPPSIPARTAAWLNAAVAVLKKLCEEREELTSDDFWARSQLPEGLEPRLFGRAVTRAREQGYLVPTGRWHKTRISRRHASDVPVYRSRICKNQGSLGIARVFNDGYAAGVGGRQARDTSQGPHWLAGWDAGYRERPRRHQAVNDYLHRHGYDRLAVVSLASCDNPPISGAAEFAAKQS